ncbi:MAG: hypothetical protein K0S44_3388 [Bacteroidetes bacterium]|nr:hypothetical protein [Bacteroidota bacterium]
MKKLFLIPFLLTFFVFAGKSSTEQVPVFSKTNFEKSKNFDTDLNSKIDQKTIGYPKGKKKRGISSSIAFVANPSFTIYNFNITQVSYKPQQDRINIRFSGNGKRGPPVLI